MTTLTAQARIGQVTRRSVVRMREIVRSGSLQALAAVDIRTGEVEDPEARALFASLPTVTPATNPDELVDHGLLPRVPAGLASLAERPRYRDGRGLFVRTSVSHSSQSSARPVGAFDPEGRVGFTHRAILRAWHEDDFLVELEGADRLLPFARMDVFGWNEPTGVPPGGGSLSGVQIDYNEPRLKAYICGAYLELGREIAALQFDGEPDTLREAQKSLIHRLASRVNMSYSGQGEGYGGLRASALIDGGVGVCFAQRAVAAGLLQTFARVMGFQVQVGVGRTLRLGVPHGFLVITLMPSLDRYVCDPAWSEPLTDIDVAFFGPGWGHDRMLEELEGEQRIVVREAAVDLPEAQP